MSSPESASDLTDATVHGDEDGMQRQTWCLTEFHPGVDTVDDYEDRLLLYCEGPNDFLTSVGATTYTLLKNLVSPQKPQELELKALVALLKTHYQPKIIVIAERFRFYKRQQRDSETIAHYWPAHS